MRVLLGVIGLLLIAFAIYNTYVLSSRPLAVVSVNGGLVEVYPGSGSLLSVLSVSSPKGVRLVLSNVSGVMVGGRPAQIANGSIVVSGRGVVPVKIGGSEIDLLFDSEGRFLALSTYGGAEVSGGSVNASEFGKAVLTYTLAPFVSGLAFTFGALAIGRRRVRRR